MMPARAWALTHTDSRGIVHQWVVEPAPDTIGWLQRYGNQGHDGRWHHFPSTYFPQRQPAIDASRRHRDVIAGAAVTP